MTVLLRLLSFVIVGFLVTACAGTKTTDSWSDQSFKRQIKNVYLIGIAKNDINRMIFEDNFEKMVQTFVNEVSRDLKEKGLI